MCKSDCLFGGLKVSILKCAILYVVSTAVRISTAVRSMSYWLFLVTIALTVQHGLSVGGLPALSPPGTPRDELIVKYFHFGLPYRLIIAFLVTVHGICISLAQLKRVLKRFGLCKKWTRIDLEDASRIIERELEQSGVLLGYRAMWHRLRLKYHLHIPRHHVRHMIKILDPEGVKQRKTRRLYRRVYRNKGPNFVWHIDQYDKLKPYGFPIHGCVDGYSRRILWLKTGVSNNNPRVVAGHYLDCVKTMQGCPTVVRTDLGTENSTIAFLQPFLRRNHSDSLAGMSSFRYGRSTSNQRIECWWSLLRKWSSDWWIDLFKMMKEAGLYDDYNQVHQDCLKFCFTEVIQSELNEVCQEWNSHLIRKSRMAETPHGIPDELYFLSQIQGGEDFKKQYDPLDLALAEQYVERAEPAFSRTFLNLMDIIMTEDGLSPPSTPQEALALYVHFCNVIM